MSFTQSTRPDGKVEVACTCGDKTAFVRGDLAIQRHKRTHACPKAEPETGGAA